ncbi:uncharacterized protein LOC128202677 isoform X3 [Mya arenaria]|uniref:uncharacterized protein LOC128202677 isoform X3 n=1 Tax=Mya arenaria TaxID=6604 RepID=UPI0022E3C328|nr:uncharacterized protein LOC128202677 isoform X3 [Mya arenaria]
MMLMLVCVFVLLGVQGLQGQDVCRNKCRTELCYLADETDCRRFIMCEEVAPGNQYTAIVMHCAYGTFWAGLQVERTILCDSQKNVNCSINYCEWRKKGEKFDLQDSNCKIYWECSSGVLTPSCCGEQRKFDPKAKACVADLTCADQCPIKKVADTAFTRLCRKKCRTELCYLADETDCRRFIMCEEVAPGNQYTATVMHCAYGTFWAGLQVERTILCDSQKNVNCSINYCEWRKEGEKFGLHDSNCKIYWECSSGVLTPSCCGEQRKFDPKTKTCVADLFCADQCPIKKDVGSHTSMPAPGVCSQTVMSAPDVCSHTVMYVPVADTAFTRLCRKKCRTELCYLAEETDCRRFIMCEEVAPGNQYTATVMQCAYGTFWAGLQVERTILCDSQKNVNCSINYCEGRKEGEKFDLQDSNCKIYWECSSGVLTPSCCGEQRKFDPKAKACVADLTCADQCTIKKDICKKGVQKYEIQDSHCRTYMLCNVELGDERWCCPSGRKFDSGTECCVPLEEADKCNDYCPPGYKE